jgi:hypothetical protein
VQLIRLILILRLELHLDGVSPFVREREPYEGVPDVGVILEEVVVHGDELSGLQ